MCETFMARLPMMKGGAMLGAKETLVKEDQLGALQSAFLIVVSRYLYILGGGIYCTTRGVTSLHANLLCSPCWSGERSH